MLMQYSYENAMDILDLLKNNKIAQLQVSEKDGVIAIDYTLTSNLSYTAQEESNKILETSLNERLYLYKLWHDFIVSKSAGRDVHLDVYFNSVNTNKLDFSHCVVGNFIYSDDGNTDYEKAMHALQILSGMLNKIGISKQQVGNVYRKEGVGRSKKYVPLALDDLVDCLFKAVQQ